MKIYIFKYRCIHLRFSYGFKLVRHCRPGFGEPSHGERLHFLELCAGAHRLTDTACEFGLNALAMDVPRQQLQSVTTKHGEGFVFTIVVNRW